MVKFFVIQIRLGRITLEQVPAKFRDVVAKELGETGGETD